mmetsp:Transcript_8925/g.18695  ORF Transcript_8925/g.18695 Transcript_8925/m.18695 type:complete len:379 (+) Transcript_8925:102-1238(+)|eukprot:CAMPEP_0201123514 /NCGR_PEP_ID=MMETSP0850-20130426/7421_1 /ASSEMBLY_ACC=CAM_ASM_000622 /TAXON_ID=183588 /ORGANISM="Pseudo-nitzschia fraudulenta, Strain WWA7" /LENGTH=378 /DNA_ID=CAMNT_0047390483 /DNA_START=84 /DNA_END=1220 /DNA_ORIENTATION=-
MKNILISFDGTGNNARDFVPDEDNDTGFSNIVKMHWLAGGDINNRRNDVPGQVCLYQIGIGAETENECIGFIRFNLGNLDQQVVPMKEKLAAVYEKGDKLFIIGFSRGSASARQFISNLYRDGITMKDGEKVEKVPVEFLGCFDTVSMQLTKHLPNIIWNRRHDLITTGEVVGEVNGEINPKVGTMVHMISLNDDRFKIFAGCFPPVFMDSKDERVHEAYFSGVHADVGGGYYRDGCSDIAFVYMQEWLESKGIKFIKPEEVHPDCLKIDHFPDTVITAEQISVKPDITKLINMSKAREENPSFRPVVTATNSDIDHDGHVKIHVSVLERLKLSVEDPEKYPYRVNPNLKNAKVVVVGSLGKAMEDETAELVDLLSKV